MSSTVVQPGHSMGTLTMSENFSVKKKRQVASQVGSEAILSHTITLYYQEHFLLCLQYRYVRCVQ